VGEGIAHAGERAVGVPVRIVVYPADVRISGVSAELAITRSLRELRVVLEAKEPAALVIDLESGGHGALDVVRERRARGSSVPVLVLAPLGDAEAAERARALGSCRVIARESATSAVVSAALNELLELVPSAEQSRSVTTDASRAPAMLFKTDPEGGFSHFTRRWLAYLGLTESAARGHGWLECIHPEDRGTWAAELAARLEERGEFAADLRVCTSAGLYRWVRFSAIPGFDAKSEFTGFVGSVFEIDDLVHARERALMDVARLEVVSSELEELALAGAHDLQEPLRSLEQELQGALSGDAADLPLALRQVTHMRELLRDLVDYAGASALHVAAESTDLAQALDCALENLRAAIAESGAEIKIETLTRVVADPIQIARVFQNLVANALRFRGDERPIIGVGAAPREHDVLVCVRDNGIGIPVAHHETIFGVFERLHGDQRPGTGMGLAICRRLLERQGGRIWVESQPHGGAAFYFTLPRD
jgi:PAS domain S-box-containing protein